MKKYIIPLLIIAALIIAGCNGSDTDPTPTPTPTTEVAKAGDTIKAHYTGTYDDGSEFDSSYGRGQPIEFTIGAGQMIPGFDQAVDGMYVGEVKTVRLAPEEAYGEYDEANIIEIPRSQLDPEADPQVGDQLFDAYGNAVTVTAISETTVTIDTNHHLAGEYLNFEIELVEIVSEATPTPVPTPFEGPTTYLAFMNTSMGNITIELYRDKVPTTVDNFVRLAQDGFYNDMIFYRVMDDFMIQAGKEMSDGTIKQSPYDSIDLEIHPDVRHIDGAISMARSNDPNSATAEFFICDGAQPGLDDGYAAFGVVIEGIEVIRDIAAQPHDNSHPAGGGIPSSQIVINSIEIQEGS